MICLHVEYGELDQFGHGTAVRVHRMKMRNIYFREKVNIFKLFLKSITRFPILYSTEHLFAAVVAPGRTRRARLVEMIRPAAPFETYSERPHFGG